MSLLRDDRHLANILRHIRENLLANKPTMAFTWLDDLNDHLYDNYGEAVEGEE